MESINRLREWANGLHGVYINQVDHTITVTTGWDAPPDMDSVSLRDHINGILYAIEREVGDARDRDYRNDREDAEGAVEFTDRLCRASERREDVTLWGVDYMAYPLDADGVPINVGDWITGDWDAKAKVVAITSEDVYWWEPDGCHWCHAYEVRHYHAPTVEDVLREFALACEDAGNAGPEVERIAAEYAAKLRLAEDNSSLYEWERDE